MSKDVIYGCPNKDCEGNGFVVGKEGAYWTCGYCGTLLQRKHDLPTRDITEPTEVRGSNDDAVRPTK